MDFCGKPFRTRACARQWSKVFDRRTGPRAVDQASRAFYALPKDSARVDAETGGLGVAPPSPSRRPVRACAAMVAGLRPPDGPRAVAQVSRAFYALPKDLSLIHI